MAKSFFDKLNHLVKSQVNDIISPIDERTSRARKKALSRMDIRRGLQDDVKVLRERIDDALAYQDELQAKTDKLYAEIADWDEKADAAVSEGREDDARIAIGRMQQAQRELEMTEASLEEHRFVTQELISQVNTLDSVVSEAEQNAANEKPPADDDSVDLNAMGEQIVQRMDETRRQLSDLVSGYYKQAQESTSQLLGQEPKPEPKRQVPIQRSRTAAPPPEPPAPRAKPAHPVQREKVDEDLEARLARLSKPEKDE